MSFLSCTWYLSKSIPGANNPAILRVPDTPISFPIKFNVFNVGKHEWIKPSDNNFAPFDSITHHSSFKCLISI